VSKVEVAFSELVQDVIALLAGQINACGVQIDVAPDLSQRGQAAHSVLFFLSRQA